MYTEMGIQESYSASKIRRQRYFNPLNKIPENAYSLLFENCIPMKSEMYAENLGTNVVCDWKSFRDCGLEPDGTSN